MNIDLLRENYKRKKRLQKIKEEQKEETEKKIFGNRREIDSLIMTRKVLNDSIQIALNIFKEQIEETITKSIQDIFGRNLEFKFIFYTKAKTKTKLKIYENGKELSPKDDLGGSIIDIISLCLRIIRWKISKEKTGDILILDEPFKWVGKLSLLTGMVLRKLSEDLKFQVIMTTHDDNLIEVSDRIFEVKNINGVSKVEVLRR